MRLADVIVYTSVDKNGQERFSLHPYNDTTGETHATAIVTRHGQRLSMPSWIGRQSLRRMRTFNSDTEAMYWLLEQEP